MRPQITRDWARAFPELGVYKPMWLARRFGPVVQGLCLDRNSANDAYAPIPHLHCLARPFPVVSLAPGGWVADERSGAALWVRAGLHERDLEKAVRAVRSQTVLPLDGRPTAAAVVEAYHGFIVSGPIWWNHLASLREDLALVLAWFGRIEEAEGWLTRSARDMEGWEPGYIPVEGVADWLERQRTRVRDRDGMEATIAEQVRSLKLNRIPVCRTADD